MLFDHQYITTSIQQTTFAAQSLGIGSCQVEKIYKPQGPIYKTSFYLHLTNRPNKLECFSLSFLRCKILEMWISSIWLILALWYTSYALSGNTKRGSITVPLTSCLTGLDQSVLQIKTKIVNCHRADSKQVKQEVNGTVILPPLVFPGSIIDQASCFFFKQLLSDTHKHTSLLWKGIKDQRGSVLKCSTPVRRLWPYSQISDIVTLHFLGLRSNLINLYLA